ncbi:hypothetical protein BAU15_08260 [Enterococcus sp. JM4C]|uniref:putative ABC exporter domain-containing protein n=1 Tax=Candidatus Enterococcus huntleyi TaxID=1857217 RepID=UPI00137B02C0|nr:putative ABC exporter domain-containing protein [Enterococcus sp. JM4C]KAF1297888.1 hypothetical protein BAU15_08260 [Enterococcus sp. JM4C]
MKQLINLYFTKKKAKIRSMFAKPTSAIITLLVIAIMAVGLFPLFKGTSNPPLDEVSVLVIGIVSLVLMLFMFATFMLQRKQALFFEEDSYYLFIGPYTDKQILGYTLIDAAFQSVMCALVITLLIFMGTIQLFTMPLGYILNLFVTNTLAYFLLIVFTQYLYLKDLISGKKSKIRLYLVGAVVLAIVGFVAYNAVQNGLQMDDAIRGFVYQKEFYYVPFIGWAKSAFDTLNGNILGILIPYALFSVFSILFSILTVRAKGDFYEQAMVDALDYTEYYKRAMAGKTEEANQKVVDSSVNYKPYAGAILSKNILVLKKTRKFFKTNDFFSIAMVIGMGALIANKNFMVYVGFAVCYLIMNVGESALEEDLKNNYIYLIPDSAIKKMFYALLIPVCKTLLMSVLMMLPALFLVNPSTKDFIVGLVVVMSFVFVLFAGNVLSLRVMKTRSNQMINSTLRMVVTAVILAPSVGLIYLLYKINSDILGAINVFIPVMLFFNLGLSGAILYACSSMMNGNALQAD